MTEQQTGKIVKIGECIVNINDHVIIKDQKICRPYNTVGWKFLKIMIDEYPEPVEIRYLQDHLPEGSRSEDGISALKTALEFAWEYLGKDTIKNIRTKAYYISDDVKITEITQQEYACLYYDCLDHSLGTKKSAGRLIRLRHQDGQFEEVRLIKSFGIVDINKDFVILSKDEEDGLFGNHVKIYVSEVVETDDGQFELKQIDDAGLFGCVRVAMIELSLGEDAVLPTETNMQIVKRIIKIKNQIECMLLEYPFARKYFFEERDKMPQSYEEYHRVIAIANMFAPLFYEIESNAKILPSFVVNTLLTYERKLYQTKAIGIANAQMPENWMFMENIPIR